MDNQNLLSNVTPELRDRLQHSRSIAILAGAGISHNSGLPVFRGPQSMDYFAGYAPAYLLSSEMLKRSPEIFWQFVHHYRQMISESAPNIAHKLLAAWQQEALRRVITKLYLLTTNIDGLLQRAGANEEHLCELFGNLDYVKCSACANRQPISEVDAEVVPYCSCGALLRPDTVLLYENISRAAYDYMITAARGCELLLVIGTSGVQSHIVNLVCLAKTRGATVIEINPSETYITQYAQIVLRGTAEEMLPQFEYCESVV